MMSWVISDIEVSTEIDSTKDYTGYSGWDMGIAGLVHGSVGLGYFYDLHPDSLVGVIAGKLNLDYFVSLGE